jgi:NAD(P)-dependent dehydrogenase (short-subunit alcohol dehydrogenase family)
MEELSGKTALVTGSTDGVGRLVARKLWQAGARVLVHGPMPREANDRGGAPTCQRAAGDGGLPADVPPVVAVGNLRSAGGLDLGDDTYPFLRVEHWGPDSNTQAAVGEPLYRFPAQESANHFVRAGYGPPDRNPL